ncbi:tagatose-bisphosphate aldolase [Candidatus Campbellbacteria bacterium RIFOXYC2_FULL_35_25]|uniref:Tagatose-bisphosphate aldolase n=1 Tax=Candidatus Campbellbacteria bacterium RIFOXYC2_FULL_35_25 TaxID=1797582 RepID=A0A1F5EHP5_9BACT|nr:MAG: tagatose-bisphosphate aldolase [Candidatus Campbellbacteria bacterium RIFOXYC2_FULL_35_25]
MKNLKQIIEEAEENKIAVGHFNISNIEGLWGIFNAARELNLPVIIGASEGERKFVGTKQVAVLVKSLREEFDYPIFSNADHCKSFESLKEAVDAGFDAVIFDGGQLSLEENIETAKKCVEYAKSVNPDILVEGELGYIGGSSKMLDEIPEGVALGEMMTSPEDAKRFVAETGVDLFTPAVGNIHGMLKGAKNPNLDIERIGKIKEAIKIPIVLHGGSGISDEDFVSAIKSGVSIVHINTEIRLAYKNATEQSIKDNPEEIAPYKRMELSVKAISEVVKKRLELFSSK